MPRLLLDPGLDDLLIAACQRVFDRHGLSVCRERGVGREIGLSVLLHDAGVVAVVYALADIVCPVGLPALIVGTSVPSIGKSTVSISGGCPFAMGTR